MPSSEHKKAWVLTPNQDYTATGVLQVGQILTDYMDPNSAVLHSGTKPIPQETLVDQSTHHGVDYSSEDKQQVAFRAWIKESLMKAFGASAGAQFETVQRNKYSSHTIGVFLFQPSTAYCRDSLALGDAPLLHKIPWWKTHRRVWMVTGLRVLGKGAKVTEGFVKNSSGKLAAQADSTVAEVPLQGGAGGGFSSEHAASHSINDADPFVYAYRLHEIIVARRFEATELGAFTRGGVSAAGEVHVELGGESDGAGDEEVDGEPEVVGYRVLEVPDEAFDGDGDEANPMLVE
ncbi:hypothetical protein MAPG_10655 [Magnaporthiopsis poae ATCC 64411]|uniref:Uncharacterized protein n=1 Tax=Magnaporthiopsis poae (strain ATCC 64411 / 73-15) TaxID=644358 RepID=A0A0C4ED62_MAGP6|nr:hypothetical protein MAPG_10655 [Magnaporthiopsis poae ATCC 64411]